MRLSIRDLLERKKLRKIKSLGETGLGLECDIDMITLN